MPLPLSYDRTGLKPAALTFIRLIRLPVKKASFMARQNLLSRSPSLSNSRKRRNQISQMAAEIENERSQLHDHEGFVSGKLWNVKFY